MSTSLAISAARGVLLKGDELRCCWSGATSSDGHRDGFGVFTYPNRFYRYEGEYVQGRKHGRGKLAMRDGGFYTGEFRDDEICGAGVRHHADGSRYEGAFEAGEAHGRGCLVSCRGWRYTGEFRHNRFHGEGTQLWDDGQKYVGGFEQHRFHGRGVLTRPDGYRYEGEWREGRQSGRGVETKANGDVYEGEFANGRYEGVGTLRLRASCISYVDCEFLGGAPTLAPTRLGVQYPQVVDKKKGPQPPVLVLGVCCPDSLVFTVEAQAHAAQAAPSDRVTPQQDGAEPAPAHEWVTCEAEMNRPVTMRLHEGAASEEGGAVRVGRLIESPELAVLLEPAPRNATAPDAAPAAGAGAAPGGAGLQAAAPSTGPAAAEGAQGSADVGQADASGRQADVAEPAAEVCVGSVAGRACFRGVKVGAMRADGKPSLQPGLYSLVWASPGLPDAVAVVSLELAPKKKRGE